ncbi:MAG: polysaccharide deacetylase family protein [Tepidanaerobacteraceae bacterium]|nr:polysaccharide deacetylase family protein [Tepidanaerobacteraceae bacterium]
MYQFLIVAILSYIIGSLFTIGNGNRKYSLEFAKGFLTLLLSGFYLHSGLSYLMASVGVLAAQSRPIFSKVNGYSAEAVSLGIIFYMSPIMGVVLALFFIVLKRVLKEYDQAVFASCLTIPIMAFRTFRSDSFIIISSIIFASLTIQFWPPFLERRIKSVVLYNMAIGLGVLGFLILLYFNKYVYKGFGVQKDIIRHGPHHFKYVALTFDDGPDSVYTPEILDILKERDVRATFFLIGKNVSRYPEIAQRMVMEGHSIGSHTHSHKSLIPLSAKSTYKEIKNAEVAIEEATGIRPTLFRPPRGVYSSYARDLLKEERYTLVLWDLSAVDWAELAPKKIVANVVNKVKPGSIILLHDSGDLITYRGGDRHSTVKALPEIIDKLRTQGYEFVTIDQMIFLSELMETEEYLHEDYLSPSPAY